MLHPQKPAQLETAMKARSAELVLDLPLVFTRAAEMLIPSARTGQPSRPASRLILCLKEQLYCSVISFRLHFADPIQCRWLA